MCRLWDCLARWFIDRALATNLEEWDLKGAAYIAKAMSNDD